MLQSRFYLFVPADRPERIAKARESGPALSVADSPGFMRRGWRVSAMEN